MNDFDWPLFFMFVAIIGAIGLIVYIVGFRSPEFRDCLKDHVGDKTLASYDGHYAWIDGDGVLHYVSLDIVRECKTWSEWGYNG